MFSLHEGGREETGSTTLSIQFSANDTLFAATEKLSTIDKIQSTTPQCLDKNLEESHLFSYDFAYVGEMDGLCENRNMSLCVAQAPCVTPLSTPIKNDDLTSLVPASQRDLLPRYSLSFCLAQEQTNEQESLEQEPLLFQRLVHSSSGSTCAAPPIAAHMLQSACDHMPHSARVDLKATTQDMQDTTQDCDHSASSHTFHPPIHQHANNEHKACEVLEKENTNLRHSLGTMQSDLMRDSSVDDTLLAYQLHVQVLSLF